MSAWRSGVRAALAAALVTMAGCGAERVVAPGECPSLCPSGEVQLADTTLYGIVTSDSSFRGYVASHEVPILVLANRSDVTSAAVLRFGERRDFWFEPGQIDTLRIAAVDSVTISLNLVQRDTTARNIWIKVYRAPRRLDTAATFDSLAPFIHDSALIDSVEIPDSIVSGTVTRRLPAGVFEPLPEDSGRVAAILTVRADTQTMVTITSADGTGTPTRIQWYVHAADTTKTHVFLASPEFDQFAQNPPPPAAAPGVLYVGNVPSARALLRFDIPSFYIDSVTIVRGTLVLTQVRAAFGRPGDVFVLEARAIVRDFGAKSYFTPDLPLVGQVVVRTGDTAQIELNMTSILRTWRGVHPDTLPRTVVLRMADEGLDLGDVAIARASTAGAPFLRVTYIKPYTFGVP